MTDFFADLEREIRAAHPRRPRPVVPVRGIAVSAAAAATLAALVLALGSLSGAGESERAATAPQQQEGWTAYAPGGDCGGEIVDEPVPQGALDRFAILRGDREPVTLPDERIPTGMAAILRESMRPVAGPEDRKYLFAVARLAGENCEPSPMAPCLISIESREFACAFEGASDPLMTYLIERAGDRSVVAVLAEDGVDAVGVSWLPGHPVDEVELDANTGFQVVGGYDENVDPTLNVLPRPEKGVLPLEGEGCVSDLDVLERRLPAFSRPADPAARSLGVTPPRDHGLFFIDEARIFEAHGVRYAVFPGCGTAVCMWREGTDETDCQALPSREQDQLVMVHHTPRGDETETAGLVAGKARAVRFGELEAPVRDGFFAITHPSGEPKPVEVVPAS